MGVLTSTATIPAAVQGFFDRNLLRRAVPKLVYMKVAQRRSLKSRSGPVIKFRRYGALPLALTPLVEGHPPAGRQMSKTDISATIQQYGDFIPLTDLVQVTVESDVLNEASRLLGEQSAQSLDALMRDVACAGTDCYYGGGVAGRGNLLGIAQKVDSTILDRVGRGLSNQNASTFTELVQGTMKVGTTPIRPAYWAITHPDVIFTLRTLTGWVDVEKYASQNAVMEAEVGEFKGIRFLQTTQAKVYRGGGGSYSGDVQKTAGVADVYTILVFGTDAIAAVSLDMMSLTNIIKPLGSGGTGDPLNQIATSGWKYAGARVRLNEAFMTRIEVTAGLLAP